MKHTHHPLIACISLSLSHTHTHARTTPHTAVELNKRQLPWRWTVLSFSGISQILLPGMDDVLLGWLIHGVGLEKVDSTLGQMSF